MKKLLTILLTTLMILTLAGCDSNKEEAVILEEPTIQEEIVVEEDNTILGGFTEAEDKDLTDELINIFNKACEGYVGISLKPVRLEGTQVVAGTNYKFLANGTKTTNPPIKGSYFVTVYKDLEGNCSITDIETVTESTGDVDGDVSDYNYWVVFYNPDGNELQRIAQKLGTTPKYEGEEPCYWDDDYWYKFVCWTDKQGNEIEDFKPITGNTYVYAKYEVGGELKQEKDEPIPSGPVAVTFFIGGSGYGYMQEENSLTSYIFYGEQRQFPRGTDFSTDGAKITIDGVTYVAREVHGEIFDHWEYNDVQVTSGQILENSVLNAVFGPPM